MLTIEQIYRQPPPGAVSTRPMTSGEMAVAQLYGPDGRPLPASAFGGVGIDAGPGTPYSPRFGDDRPPREFQYPIGWNYIPNPRSEDRQRMQAFAILRLLALQCPYPRIAINYRKQQIAGMDYDVVVSGDSKSKTARAERQDEIDEVKRFFRSPNRFDGTAFSTWVKQALEEIFITDALCFYKLVTRAGDLHSLVQIDGTTIKPIIDEYGHIVSYQQILYGYPVTGYSAWKEAEKQAQGTDLLEFAAGDMLYLIHNPKVDGIYGTSPMEEIMPIIQLGISRINYQNTWYTAGTVPDGFIEAPENFKMPQVKEMQDWADDIFAGNDKKRHTARVLPFGSKWTQVTKGLNYSKDEEEALISAVCAHFAVPRSLFVSTVNRATGEMQRDEQQDVGFKPLKIFFKDIFDRIISDQLHKEGLEFQWVDTPAGNEYEIAEARALYVTSGILQADEVRAEMGLEPLPEVEPDANTAADGTPLPAGSAAAAGKPGAAGKKPTAGNAADAKGAGGNPDAGDGAEKADVGEELREWRRFALKRVQRGKAGSAFETEAVPEGLKVAILHALRKAMTSADVLAIFEKAQTIASKRKEREKDLEGSTKRLFNEQKESALRHAAKVLPTSSEAAA